VTIEFNWYRDIAHAIYHKERLLNILIYSPLHENSQSSGRTSAQKNLDKSNEPRLHQVIRFRIACFQSKIIHFSSDV